MSEPLEYTPESLDQFLRSATEELATNLQKYEAQLHASLPELWVVIDKLRAAQKISRRLLDREITI